MKSEVSTAEAVRSNILCDETPYRRAEFIDVSEEFTVSRFKIKW
jgi:hypothetical protein